MGIAVSDIERSRAFYEAALAPLDMKVMKVWAPSETEHGGNAVLFGGDAPCFVIADGERPGEGTHIAFRANSREAVEGFHRAALAAGGSDNGPPGIRTAYGPDYYAAFVHDPDGVNVEAVCHVPVEAPA